jgi:hypothetical protein
MQHVHFQHHPRRRERDSDASAPPTLALVALGIGQLIAAETLLEQAPTLPVHGRALLASGLSRVLTRRFLTRQKLRDCGGA